MELTHSIYLQELEQDELYNTDGGIGWPVVVLVCVIILAVCCTTKGCADADQGK
jgi:lactobin A/cerein 7B family class IIb bacteriocin